MEYSRWGEIITMCAKTETNTCNYKWTLKTSEIIWDHKPLLSSRMFQTALNVDCELKMVWDMIYWFDTQTTRDSPPAAAAHAHFRRTFLSNLHQCAWLVFEGIHLSCEFFDWLRECRLLWHVLIEDEGRNIPQPAREGEGSLGNHWLCENQRLQWDTVL